MELKFDKPIVPNFVKTDKGRFDIKDLSPDELIEFKTIWYSELVDNQQRRIKQTQKGD